MERKGINKIYYKLWKHFGKKIGLVSPPPPLPAALPTVSLERQILNEIIALRKYLILRDICPEIINAITPKISYPSNETGNETFLTYFRYLDKKKTPSPYAFLWNWLPSVAVDVNATLMKYQSAQFSPEEYRSNINRYATEDLPASIKNNIGYLGKILYLGDAFGDGEEFCSNIIHSNNFEKYTPYGYMLLCNFFLYKNQLENAKKSLDMYVKKMGRRGIDEWLAVANFAYQNGMKEFSLQRAVFNEIINTTKEDLFSQKIQGRTVALIGNGPQELGRNQKKVIDSHEIVIRMNAYDLTPGYVKDYGEKCDIWYQYLGLTDREWKKIKGAPRLYFIGQSPYSARYPRQLVNRYANELSKGIKIQTVKLSDLSQIYKMTRIYNISGGLLMTYLIKKGNPKFSADDCFGFSFKENKENLSWTHTDGEMFFMTHHSLEQERPVIRELLSRERI